MTRSQAGWWMIGGGVVAIVGGLFLPWATLTAPLFGTLELYGSEGDGWFVAIGGVLAIIGGLMAKNGNRGAAPKVLGVIGFILVVAVALNDFPGLAGSMSDEAMARLGTGVYAVGVGAFGMMIGLGTLLFQKFPNEPSMDTADAPMLSDAERDLRVESLMNTDGLTWKQAWDRVDRENRTRQSDDDRVARIESLMESDGLTWQEAWKRTEGKGGAT